MIFDRRQVRRARQRAGSMCGENFLRDEVEMRLRERLADVRRKWRAALIHGAWGEGEPLSGALEVRTDLAGSRLVGAKCPAVVGDEECWPFADESFDLVVSCLMLHSVNDLPGALVGLRRMLRPDAYFLAALLAGETLTELRYAFAAAESALAGRVHPRIGPFSDIRDLGGLLQRAGFALPVADLDHIRVHYGEPLKLFRDLRAAGETNALEERSRIFLRRDVLSEVERIYEDRFANGDGIEATFDIVFLSGWAPHPDQPQPLKPGSATKSLVDVLEKPSRS